MIKQPGFAAVRIFAVLTVIFISLAIAPSAWALTVYTIDGSGNGSNGGCAAFGAWDGPTHTCTLNRDVTIPAGTGIELTADNVILDGAGHTITGDDMASNSGIYIGARTGNQVRNLNISNFGTGISFIGTNDGDILSNHFSGCGIGVSLSVNSGSTLLNQLMFNTFQANGTGVLINNSNNNRVSGNNFIGNTAQATVTGTSAATNFITNYWDNHDSRIEGCVNTTPFDWACDSPYAYSGTNSDPSPAVLRNFWDRTDWTWYDNVGGSNWILLANRPGAGPGFVYDLTISGMAQTLGSIPGFGPGYVRPGDVIYNRYSGLTGGPVTAEMRYEGIPVASQRSLWPAGGNSLEEVPGTTLFQYDSTIYWPWYDQRSPGYKDWVLVSNLNGYQINYNVKVAGAVQTTGTIPAYGKATPSFPGLMGGPVEVNAWNDNGDPVYIMASQRVLSNADMAFNEVPGTPKHALSNDYVWTWYDMTGDTRNWILVANTNIVPIYYEIWIAGAKVADGGPIAPLANETPTFPGRIGGPVEVKSFSDAGHLTTVSSIVSQRSVWGPSFEEVPGLSTATLDSTYDWTWYDQASAGAQNWILVATQPGEVDTVTAEITFTDQNTGLPVTMSHNITTAEKRWTPTFPGKMGGPVEVKAWKWLDAGTTKDVIVSQRVIWNGFFNEVWGQ